MRRLPMKAQRRSRKKKEEEEDEEEEEEEEEDRQFQLQLQHRDQLPASSMHDELVLDLWSRQQEMPSLPQILPGTLHANSSPTVTERTQSLLSRYNLMRSSHPSFLYQEEAGKAGHPPLSPDTQSTRYDAGSQEPHDPNLIRRVAGASTDGDKLIWSRTRSQAESMNSRYVAEATSSMPASGLTQYAPITWGKNSLDFMAQLLYDMIVGEYGDPEVIGHLATVVPSVLSRMASDLTVNPSSSEDCNFANFINHCRFDIDVAFITLCYDEFVNLKHSRWQSRERLFRLDHRDQHFETHETGSEREEHIDPTTVVGSTERPREHIDEGFEESPPLRIDEISYLKTLRHNAIFQRLADAMKRSIRLDWRSASALKEFRAQIFECLPRERDCEISCKIDGAHIVSLAAQLHPDALRHTITLTGSPECPQALTSEEYILRVWPETGTTVLDVLLQGFGRGSLARGWLVVDGIPRLSLRLRISSEHVRIVARGCRTLALEACEVLTWLSSAFHPSKFASGVTQCEPVFRSTRSDVDTVECQVGYSIERECLNREYDESSCWTNLLRNPVLVRGFPVARRQASCRGLEMSLGAMAQLMGTMRLHLFDSRLYLKGFSALLVAVASTPDATMWHYLYNTDGTHIPYLATEYIPDGLDETEASSLFTSRLHLKRHFIGWCSDSAYLIGSKSASYAIDETGLPPPRAGSALEKFTIQGGKVITFGVQIALGQRDIPPHLPPDSYVSKLLWLEKKYIILWDEAEKRGWLANGISALLHLVRARLSSLRAGDFAPQLMLSDDNIEDSNECKANSAVRLLLHERNRCLGVFSGKNKSTIDRSSAGAGSATTTAQASMRTHRTQIYLFEDLVEEVFDSLEQLIEYQKKAAARQGIQIKARLREQLEGWDFTDIAHGYDAHPRVTTLGAAGWGWVDFIRSINSVVLFGRGYGKLIQPRDSDGICPDWESLPPGHSYLAANVSDLDNIMRLHGSRWTKPPQLVHGLVWQSPNAPFDACPCQRSTFMSPSSIGKLRHVSPVQILSPSGFKKAKPSVNPSTFPQCSAVIFGYNASWKYSWRNNGADSVLDRNTRVTRQGDSEQTAPSPSDVLSASASTASQQTDQVASSGTMELSEISTPPTSFSAGSDSQGAIQSSSIQGPAAGQGTNTSSRTTNAQHRGPNGKTKRRSLFTTLADRLRGRGA